MKFWGMVIAFALLMPDIASADLKKDIAVCAAKSGELERLACYDGIAKRNKLDGPQGKTTVASGGGKWVVTDKVNPVDDSRTVTMVLPADSGKSKWGRPVVLIARCMSNSTEVFINWGDYLGSEADVLTRIGKNDAVTRRWSLSTDSQATFYPENGDIAFLKKIMEADSLVAQVTPYNESPTTAIFDTVGLEDAIKPLRETCHW